MVTYADSSFLVSLYIADSNTAKANTFVRENQPIIVLTDFSKSESQHAIRLLTFRGVITREVMTRGLLSFEHDQSEGLYEPHPFTMEELCQKTSVLSHRYAVEIGVRYLDALHVASALLLKANRFLTFDSRQAKLAKAAGLNVKP